MTILISFKEKYIIFIILLCNMEERWLQIPRLWPDRSDEHIKYSKYIYLAVIDISCSCIDFRTCMNIPSALGRAVL